ncbi:DUF5074 domain-containing protein [Arcicella sp. LKC2W]|uniref:YncE family protein n=1 Tax=Arcicella sp. LKC2W TaxID=2984198 RepID=UPI002B20C3E2|nr:DUF5074 domain-containing protein [Arcicella sp. LKC2W]MEA5458373.1 DUF5074 domain-containing protein [Arcicella sp. LKC2W]
MQFNSIYVRSLAVVSLFLGLNACNSTSEPEPSQPYDTGVFVLNGGNFFDNNGTISLYNPTTKTISYDVFQKENTRALSGGVAGYTEVDGKGLILVDNSTNGSDAVEIVSARTFKSVATIKDLENPRSVIKASTNKAYVVCWDVLNPDYSYKLGYVAVIDLTTNKITKKIPVQNGAEGIVIVGNEAFIGNTSYSGIKTITVIDISKDEVSGTVASAGAASNLIVDANNKIWCTIGKEIVRINPTSKVVETRLTAGTSTTKSPRNLTLNANKTAIFFEYSFSDSSDGYKQKGDIFSFNISDATISTSTSLIKRAFTGFGFDAKNGIIYGGITPSYKQAGYVIRYQTNGTLIDSVKAEIAPNGFLFK